jgi:PBSX family phage terminase large subunit
MTYAIAELKPDEPGGFCPRGAAADLWRHKGREVMLSGPAETGKTFLCCHKLDALLWKYPRSQAVMVRKTLASLFPSVFQTYRKITGVDSPIVYYGGEKKPEWADYPNGSRLYFAGMDKAGKALSSERDFIYVNQAEELTVNDWETLTTRCTGRAANAPYPQMMGDCNPGPPTHWIKHRPSLAFLESRHEDNPTLYDDAGTITERGVGTMTTLDALTGVRYLRLRKGIWAGAEGMIYEEWDSSVHEIDAMPTGWQDWRKIRSIDFGFTNPFTCQWWAIDGDGRMYLYRECYGTRRLVSDWARLINDLSQGERISETVCDHDAEDRATLASCGINSLAAHKSVVPGIEAVQKRLRRAGDGKPRLYLLRGCVIDRDSALADAHRPTCTADEISGYVWASQQDGRAAKEEPVKVNDHGLDALRYAVAFIDGLGYYSAGAE